MDPRSKICSLSVIPEVSYITIGEENLREMTKTFTGAQTKLAPATINGEMTLAELAEQFNVHQHQIQDL